MSHAHCGIFEQDAGKHGLLMLSHSHTEYIGIGLVNILLLLSFSKSFMRSSPSLAVCFSIHCFTLAERKPRRSDTGKHLTMSCGVKQSGTASCRSDKTTVFTDASKDSETGCSGALSSV